MTQPIVKCPRKRCRENYLGEATTRINNKKSQMFRHTLQFIHASLSLNEYKILGKGFNDNRVKRKISEALLIKQYRTTLKTQENSIALELFNLSLGTLYG